MTKPLSSDLRERLIEAVAAGMSRRAGRIGPQGGDKRSDRIEAHAREILGLVAETHDITLASCV